jgi:uncharacterized membrane protein (DUF2068 family)
MAGMEDTAEPAPHLPHIKLEPLRWIGAYKLVKAAMALFMALVVLRWAHRDLPEVASHWMERLHITAESRLGRFISQKVILIHAQSLMRAAIFLFVYATVASVEGIGLLMRKTWAEWLTALTTAGFIPFEIYEFEKRFTWVRLAILLLNVGVVVYLVWRIKRDQRKRAMIAMLGKTRSVDAWAATSNQEGRAQQAEGGGG